MVNKNNKQCYLLTLNYTETDEHKMICNGIVGGEMDAKTWSKYIKKYFETVDKKDKHILGLS